MHVSSTTGRQTSSIHTNSSNEQLHGSATSNLLATLGRWGRSGETVGRNHIMTAAPAHQGRIKPRHSASAVEGVRPPAFATGRSRSIAWTARRSRYIARSKGISKFSIREIENRNLGAPSLLFSTQLKFPPKVPVVPSNAGHRHQLRPFPPHHPWILFYFCTETNTS